MQSFVEAFWPGQPASSWIYQALVMIGTLLIYPTSTAIYNLYFHPLAKFPGPFLWRAFRAPYAISMWRGQYVHDIFDMHERLGDVVRVAPNELSYTDKQAWQDIHCARLGHKPFPKNQLWWGEFPGRAPSIVSTPSQDGHERMRRIINHCFSIKALKSQEASVQYHADLMVTKFQEQMEESGETVINIVDWYMFYTFDVLGDLAFSSPFECLQNSAMHPWIVTIFNYFKFGAYIGILRLYFGRSIDSILLKLTPKSAAQASENHYQWAVDKVHRRMNIEVPREDFLTHIMANNREGLMSMPEIENNTNVLIVAGSETCGTVLSGMTNYLLKAPYAYKKLQTEIKEAFSRPEDITFESLLDLPYLNAVIDEGLRMCSPSTAGLQHVVPDGGDTVLGEWLPEGTNVSVHSWSINRLRRKFHRSDEFVPERWLSSATSDPASPFYYDVRDGVQAYSVGMWSCIGKVLAYNELRVVLAKMVWHFDMSIAKDGRDVDWAKQKCWFLMEKEPLDVRLTALD